MGVWRWTSDGRAARFTAWYRAPRREEGDCAYIDLTGQPGWYNTACTPGYRHRVLTATNAALNFKTFHNTASYIVSNIKAGNIFTETVVFLHPALQDRLCVQAARPEAGDTFWRCFIDSGIRFYFKTEIVCN